MNSPHERPRPFDRCLMIAAALAGLTGVLAGTFAAHGLREHLPPDRLAIFHTGVQYHLVHAMAVVGVAVAARTGLRLVMVAGWAMLTGMMIFSGSLYLLAVTGQRWLGMVTPVGGVCFIVAWALLALAAWRSPR
jgi:uncharacterized membrane protein YgdD (TMEM256/DUF423 family)